MGSCMNRRHDRGCAGLNELLHTVSHYSVTAQYHDRRNDAYIPDFDVLNMPGLGNMAYVEYSVVDPLQVNLIANSRRTAGHAASQRDREKYDKYRDLAYRTHHNICTASQETTGRISAGYRAIMDMCKRNHNAEAFEVTAPLRSWASSTFSDYYSQRIAIAFFSGCADMQATRERINTLRSGLPHNLLNAAWPSMQS